MVRTRHRTGQFRALTPAELQEAQVAARAVPLRRAQELADALAWLDSEHLVAQQIRGVLSGIAVLLTADTSGPPPSLTDVPFIQGLKPRIAIGFADFQIESASCLDRCVTMHKSVVGSGDRAVAYEFLQFHGRVLAFLWCIGHLASTSEMEEAMREADPYETQFSQHLEVLQERGARYRMAPRTDEEIEHLLEWARGQANIAAGLRGMLLALHALSLNTSIETAMLQAFQKFDTYIELALEPHTSLYNAVDLNAASRWCDSMAEQLQEERERLKSPQQLRRNWRNRVANKGMKLMLEWIQIGGLKNLADSIAYLKQTEV